MKMIQIKCLFPIAFSVLIGCGGQAIAPGEYKVDAKASTVLAPGLGESALVYVFESGGRWSYAKGFATGSWSPSENGMIQVKLAEDERSSFYRKVVNLNRGEPADSDKPILFKIQSSNTILFDMKQRYDSNSKYLVLRRS